MLNIVSQLLQCFSGPGEDDGRGTFVNVCDDFAAEAAPKVSLSDLSQLYDEITSGVLVVVSCPGVESASPCEAPGLTVVYCNAVAGSFLQAAHQDCDLGFSTPASAETGLLDAFAAACGPETLERARALLRRVPSSRQHGTGGSLAAIRSRPGSLAAIRSRPASSADRNRWSPKRADEVSDPPATPSVKTRPPLRLKVKDLEPAWFLTDAGLGRGSYCCGSGAPTACKSSSVNESSHDCTGGAADISDAAGGDGCRRSGGKNGCLWKARKAGAGDRRRSWTSAQPPMPPPQQQQQPVPTRTDGQAGGLGSGAVGSCKCDGLAPEWPAVVVTFSVADAAKLIGGSAAAALTGICTAQTSKDPTVAPRPASTADATVRLSALPAPDPGIDRGRGGKGKGEGTAALLAADKTALSHGSLLRLRQLVSQRFGCRDGGGASQRSAAAAMMSTTAVAAPHRPSEGSISLFEVSRGALPRREAGALTLAVATVSGGRAGADAPSPVRPEHGEYGSLWARRESVVLSALSHMVTAFTAGCGSVLYQNTQSIAYYGRWSRPPKQQQPADASSVSGGGRVGAGYGVAEGSVDGAGCKGGTGSCDEDGECPSGLFLLLAQLFALQPAKLERMLADVLGEGCAWKGIVQVPAAIKPRNTFDMQSGAASAASHAAGPATPPGDAATPGGASGGGGPSLPSDPRQLRPPLPLALLSGQSASPAGDTSGNGLMGPAAAAAAAVANTPNAADTEVPSAENTGLRRAQSSTDFNPLATSTWGLILDTANELNHGAVSTLDTSTSVDAAVRRLLPFTSRSNQNAERDTCRSQGRGTAAGIGAAMADRLTMAADADAGGGGGRDGGGRGVGAGGGLRSASRPALHRSPNAVRAPVVPPSCSSGTRALRSEKIMSFVAASQLQMQQKQLQEPSLHSFFRGSGEPSMWSVTRGSQTKGRMASVRFGDLDVIRRSKSMLSLQDAMGAAPGAPPPPPPLTLPPMRLCATRVGLATMGDASGGTLSRSAIRVLTFAGTLNNTPSALQQALAAAGATVVGGASGSTAAARRTPSLTVASHLSFGGADGEIGRRSYASGDMSSSSFGDLAAACIPLSPGGVPPRLPVAGAAVAGAVANASCAVAAAGVRGGGTAWDPHRQGKALAGLASSGGMRRTNQSSPSPYLLASASPPPQPAAASAGGGGAAAAVNPAAADDVAAAGVARAAVHARGFFGPAVSFTSTRSDCCTATSTFPAAANSGAAVCAADSGSSRSTAALRSSAKALRSLGQLSPRAAAAAAAAATAGVAASNPSAGSISTCSDSPYQPPPAGSLSNVGRTAAAGATAAAATPHLPQPEAPQAPAPAVCWHEVTVVRTTDAASGLDLIVVTQADVTDKVEAERHLAKVAEAEHRLLEAIFPRHVLTYMTTEEDALQLGSPAAARSGGGRGSHRPAAARDINKLATSHAEVTLLFADIQGFTPMCQTLEPQVVMAFLNDLFTRFDSRLEEFGVYKVETIGDCYFVAGGLIGMDEHGMPVVRARESHADPLHAEKVLMFAKAMLAAASQVSLPTTGGPVRMRIGIHSGPVVSGVVGQRMPRFCLFGDSVNTTSRMESTGVPGCIHASEAARRLLPNEDWMPTGGIEVKGKGLMNTYLWAPPGHQLHGLSLKQPPTPATAPAAAAGGGSGAGVGSDISGHRHDGDDDPVDAACHSAGGFVQIWPPLVSLESVTESVAGLAKVLLEEGK